MARFRAPIMLPRWVLTVKYALFGIVGAAVLNTNPASFREFYDESGLTAAWSILLILVSLVAFIGTLDDRLERRLERPGVTAIFVLMVVYAVAPIGLVIAGDADRLAYSTIAVLVSLLPYARTLQLWEKKTHA